jgi:lipoyl(octanoyl) transferase
MPPTRGAYRLPHRVASGSSQMATDAKLLRWAAAASDRFVFRTYGWSRPALSLGRAEPFPGGWDVAALNRDGVEVVRRPTGGAGVLHDGEVTFATAASVPGPWRLTPRQFADAVAESVASAMVGMGLTAERADGLDSLREIPGRPGDEPCFARVRRGEVRAGGFKVAGIAARFAAGGVLCHASVPLTARHREIARYRLRGEGDRALLEERARSIGELLGRAPEPALLGDRIGAAIAERLGLEAEVVDFETLGILEP